MEQKILLKAIREDVLLLEELIGGTNNSSGLTADEVNFALGRARSLVAELEMLSRFVQPQPRTEAPSLLTNSMEVVSAKPVAAKSHHRLVGNNDAMLDLDEQPALKVEEPVQLPTSEPAPQKTAVVQPAFVEPVVAVIAPTEPKTEARADLGELTSAEKPLQKKWLGEAIEPKKSVNDLLHHEPADPLFEGKPLATLKSGIGINDRFLFTRELFAGKSEDFQLAIDQLDRCETIQQAVDYLKSNFKWSKSDSADKFLQLVKRRFQS